MSLHSKPINNHGHGGSRENSFLSQRKNTIAIDNDKSDM